MFLDSKEIADLTGKKQKAAQVRALRFMGIEHKVRPDGSLVILKAHVERILDGAFGAKKTKTIEPNWDAI